MAATAFLQEIHVLHAHTHTRNLWLIPPAADPAAYAALRLQTWLHFGWRVIFPIRFCASAWYDDTYSTWSEIQWDKRRRCAA